MNRNFKKLLLLSDGKSSSGIEFVKAAKGKYDFSEYRMKLIKFPTESMSSITLRKAEKLDWKEIARQNSIYFNDEEENESIQRNRKSQIKSKIWLNLIERS